MTVPPEAIQAAAQALGARHGCAPDTHMQEARDALKAAAPVIAAAERQRVIGYRIDGRVYHPSDVWIITKEETTDAT